MKAHFIDNKGTKDSYLIILQWLFSIHVYKESAHKVHFLPTLALTKL